MRQLARPCGRRAGPRAAGAALIALGLAPRLASACAVCFSGRDETRAAFLLTSILLSALPLLMIGSLVWWLRRRALALRRQDPGSSF
jgi:hypothetical protein